MELLRREQLNSLMGSASGPCMSLYLPTSRGGEETRQGPIRLKNLLKTAEKKLSAYRWNAAETKAFLEPVQKLAENAGFWLHQGDGLALFRAPGQFLYYRLPIRFNELAVVTERFHIKPLLRLFTEDGRYYLLSLSKNRVRFFQCTRHGAREIELPPGTPRSVSELNQLSGVEKQSRVHTGSGARLHAHGSRAGEDEKQELKEFLRLVDKAVRETVRDDRAPLVLAGVEYELAMYRDINAHPHLMAGGVVGSPEGRRVSQLLADAWPIVGPELSKGREGAAQRYTDLVGSGRVSNVLEKVVPAARLGRVEQLFVAVGRQRWGSFDEQTQRVKVRDEPHVGDQDLLDLAAVQTVLHGGSVYAVEPDQVPGGRSVAAVMRF